MNFWPFGAQNHAPRLLPREISAQNEAEVGQIEQEMPWSEPQHKTTGQEI
jgi:hypothetical protein